MAIYLMLGKYSQESLKAISAARSVKARALIKQNGGQEKASYALLGDTDLALILDLPDTQSAIKTSLGLAKLLGVSFSTVPAITVDEFDKLLG